jgi:hypothetical protein
VNELFRRLSFRLDYKKQDELKTAVMYFFAVFLFLRLLAIGLEQSAFFALVLTVGALVYLEASLYFLRDYLRGKSKKRYDLHKRIYDSIFGVGHALILIWIVYLMFAPIAVGAENTILSFIASLLLIILPASFSDEIIEGLKKRLAALFILPTGLNFTDLGGFVPKIPDLTSPFPYIQIIESLVSKFGVYLLIVIIVVALLALRVLKTILQLLLVAVIIWAIAKFFGVL